MAPTANSNGMDRAGSAPITTSCGSNRRVYTPRQRHARRWPAAVPPQPRRHDLFRSPRRAAQRSRFAADPQLGRVRRQGLAPYFFDLELTGFASGEGDLAAKLEASYDLLLTQRLILQPQIELNIYSKADPSRLVGAGFSDIDTGLRLRYEFSRKFVPYLGVVYEGRFGQTASLARQAGESTGDVRFVFGIRVWF
jgi:uncharacterized protein involved in copper resistance